MKGEQDATVADAKPGSAGHIAVKRGDVAGAGAGEMEHGVEHAHGCGAVQGADVVLGFIEPFDVVGRQTGGVGLPAVSEKFAEMLRSKAGILD